MAVLCIVPLIWLLATRPDASLWPKFVGGANGAVVGPILSYPLSKTTWVALELMLRPAEAHEPTDNR
ncbi:MAG: hypothetical protein ACRD2W_09390 [Acidimicrobiales bacterium]